MALTADQIRILNELPDYEPGLRKGEAPALKLGDEVRRVEPEQFDNNTRPLPATRPEGTIIYNTDDGNHNFRGVNAGVPVWRDSITGNPT